MTTLTRALILVLALLLGACASTDDAGDTVEVTEEAASAAQDSPTEDGEDSETDESTDEPAEAAAQATAEDREDDERFPMTGTLEVVDVEGGCLVLVVGEDEQYEVLADPGSDLAIDPANGVIADAQGNELAAAGEDVTVEGTVDAGVSTFCQVGSPLFVTEVSASPDGDSAE